MTTMERAEADKARALLHYQNAALWAGMVAGQFGLLSPEYAIATAVLGHEQAKLVEAYDALLAAEVQP